MSKHLIPLKNVIFLSHSYLFFNLYFVLFMKNRFIILLLTFLSLQLESQWKKILVTVDLSAEICTTDIVWISSGTLCWSKIDQEEMCCLLKSSSGYFTKSTINTIHHAYFVYVFISIYYITIAAFNNCSYKTPSALVKSIIFPSHVL